jgi:PAS domain S-box-containing protein
MDYPETHRFRRWLANLPLPWISVIVGIFCGSVVWLIHQSIQTHDISEVFHQELSRRLEIRAADTRRRFEHFGKQSNRLTRALAQSWPLVEHVNTAEWARGTESPLTYTNEPPPWLALGASLLGEIEPSHVLLLDAENSIREIYHRKDLPFPVDQAVELSVGQTSPMVASIWQAPYLLAWASIPGIEPRKPAMLMVVVAIDEKFLITSQHHVGTEAEVVGMLDGDQQRILSSSVKSLVGPASRLEEWRSSYMITSQALTGNLVPVGNIQFFTLMPRAEMESKVRNILNALRKQQLIEALVYVLTFTLVFYLISARLSAILGRISRFGETALGIRRPMPSHGNQLLLLEDRLIELFTQVSHAQDENQVEQAFRMRESEALKDALLDHALDPIFTVDDQGLIIEVNITAERTFGYLREQILGTALDRQVIHPEDRSQLLKLVQRCRQMDASLEHCRSQRMRGRDSHGGVIPLECTIIPISLEDGVVLTVYLRDITQRQNAEREIQALAKFASENPSPVLRVNNRGVIIYANAASQPLLEYWKCERGQTLPLFWRNQLINIMQEGNPREQELVLEDLIFALLMAPVEGMDYINIYGRDITQMRTAEQQSRKHQADLVHVCRVSTMGEMATGLAHELNQPLSAIVNFASGCVRRIQSGIGGEAELVDAMAQITVQAERASEIIKRLRTLVAKQPEEHALANLNHLVLEVASFVEYDASRNQVEVVLSLYQGGLAVEVDLVQIEQVLLNLVRNAIDAMRMVDVDRRRLELITDRLNDHQAVVIVRDSGPGIPKDVVDHLFDSFFSTKETGMGMGLSISRKIIEAHSGEISATSAMGEGAVFRVVLPSDPAETLPGMDLSAK